ncbi:MAG: hypothetical protein M3478_05885 [Planctomycetota bacterium]|nr:hypothetical protein [Planctomycetota bacterium]
MGLLDVLLNRKNPTYDWVFDPHLELVVDLDDSSFCGGSVGAPLGDLAALGPADDRRSSTGTLTWNRRGFYLIRDADHPDRMQGFVLHTVAPFSFRWRVGGRDVDIRMESTPNDVRRILGGAFHEFHDGTTDEIVWFYETPQAEWQFGWGHGVLLTVEVSAWRELATAHARESYGCTKSPPYP